MTKSPKKAAAWTAEHPEANILHVTAPDGTVYPFYHDRIHHWHFHAQAAARPDLLPADFKFREVAEVMDAVRAHHEAPVPKPEPAGRPKPAAKPKPTKAAAAPEPEPVAEPPAPEPVAEAPAETPDETPDETAPNDTPVEASE